MEWENLGHHPLWNEIKIIENNRSMLGSDNLWSRPCIEINMTWESLIKKEETLSLKNPITWLHNSSALQTYSSSVEETDKRHD